MIQKPYIFVFIMTIIVSYPFFFLFDWDQIAAQKIHRLIQFLIQNQRMPLLRTFIGKKVILIFLLVVVVFILIIGARFRVAQFTVLTFIAAVIHDCDCVVIANTGTTKIATIVAGKMVKEAMIDS